jgi:hypothetical protein
LDPGYSTERFGIVARNSDMEKGIVSMGNTRGVKRANDD